MKRFCISCLLLAGLFPAAGVFALDGVFAGLGAEANGNTREGAAAGGILLLGLDVDRQFSLGLKGVLSSDFNTVSVQETAGFLRWRPLQTLGLFAQADIGSSVFFEKDLSRLSFMGGVSAGWRFEVFKNWFVEPSLRLGWPFIWGVGVTGGYRFKASGNREEGEQVLGNREEVSGKSGRVADNSDEGGEDAGLIADNGGEGDPAAAAEAEGVAIDDAVIDGAIAGIPVERDEGGRLRLKLPPVIFRANYADYEGLSRETIDGNKSSLEQIALVLNRFGEYSAVVEGHANPTTSEGAGREGEEADLVKISGDRANAVIDELERMGIDRGRLHASGAGSSMMMAPHDDRENNWKNRRVEFILFK